MPWALPVWIDERIWTVFSSRIRFPIALVDHEQLEGRDATAAVGRGHEALRDHGAQRLGEHGPHLILLVRWERRRSCG